MGNNTSPRSHLGNSTTSSDRLQLHDADLVVQDTKPILSRLMSDVRKMPKLQFNSYEQQLAALNAVNQLHRAGVRMDVVSALKLIQRNTRLLERRDKKIKAADSKIMDRCVARGNARALCVQSRTALLVAASAAITASRLAAADDDDDDDDYDDDDDEDEEDEEEDNNDEEDDEDEEEKDLANYFQAVGKDKGDDDDIVSWFVRGAQVRELVLFDLFTAVRLIMPHTHSCSALATVLLNLRRRKFKKKTVCIR
jgi:hypothetical protein